MFVDIIISLTDAYYILSIHSKINGNPLFRFYDHALYIRGILLLRTSFNRRAALQTCVLEMFHLKTARRCVRPVGSETNFL